MNIQKITLIGAGNVAWHLGKAFLERGFEIKEVYSRQLQNAVALCAHLGVGKAVDTLHFEQSEAHLFVLCVSDAAFADVIENLKIPSTAILVHTSGSQRMEILATAHTKIGVFYAFQTFNKTKSVNIQEVPFCIEGSSSEIVELLSQLALQISSRLYFLSSEQRGILHIAAVFACNFTNFMLTISDEIMLKNGLDKKLIEPLIIETFQKALQIPPAQAQTGPALRRDTNTLLRHEQYLEQNTEYAPLYRLITEMIQNYHPR